MARAASVTGLTVAIALLALVSGAHAREALNVTEDPTLPDCFAFPGTRNVSGFDSGYQVGERSRSPICIMLGNKNSSDPLEFQKKILFFVEVDKYTLMEISDVSADNQTVTTTWMVDQLINIDLWAEVKVRVQLGSLLSEERSFTWDGPGDTRKIAGFLTLIVGLDAGFIDDLVWDDGCDGCDSKLCGRDTSETCGFLTQKCDKDELSCNPKVYIAWVGTDRKGEYATSSGSVWSRFRKYSVNTIYTNAARTSTETVPRL